MCQTNKCDRVMSKFYTGKVPWKYNLFTNMQIKDWHVITHDTMSINITKKQKLFFINYSYKIIWIKRNLYIYYIYFKN